MTPINDPRPFAEALRDFKDRHDLTYDTLSDRLDLSRSKIANALAGDHVKHERALRALMTLMDEGRA